MIWLSIFLYWSISASLNKIYMLHFEMKTCQRRKKSLLPKSNPIRRLNRSPTQKWTFLLRLTTSFNNTMLRYVLWKILWPIFHEQGRAGKFGDPERNNGLGLYQQIRRRCKLRFATHWAGRHSAESRIPNDSSRQARCVKVSGKRYAYNDSSSRAIWITFCHKLDQQSTKLKSLHNYT